LSSKDQAISPKKCWVRLQLVGDGQACLDMLSRNLYRVIKIDPPPGGSQ
jgi:hypothetical protein